MFGAGKHFNVLGWTVNYGKSPEIYVFLNTNKSSSMRWQKTLAVALVC